MDDCLVLYLHVDSSSTFPPLRSLPFRFRFHMHMLVMQLNAILVSNPQLKSSLCVNHS